MTHITGREPRLASGIKPRGQMRLSLLGLANSLNILPATSIPLPVLLEALRSDSFYVRYAAAQKLAARADRDARLMMQEVLMKEASAPTRASVARRLNVFSWFAAEPLLAHAFADADPRVRESATYALCEFHELAAYQLLAKRMQIETDTVRLAAAVGLRDCQDGAALPALEGVLKADDPEVRIKGLEALGNTELEAAMPLVRTMLQDPDPDVKYAATLSLIELAGDGCFQEMAGMIGRTKGETLRQILRGFFHATNYLKIEIATAKGGDLLIDALETALFDDVAAVRKAAIWPLAWTKHERIAGILRRAYFQEADPEVKTHILRVVLSLNEEVGFPLLEDALASDQAEIRSVAEKLKNDRAGLRSATP